MQDEAGCKSSRGRRTAQRPDRRSSVNAVGRYAAQTKRQRALRALLSAFPISRGLAFDRHLLNYNFDSTAPLSRLLTLLLLLYLCSSRTCFQTRLG